jgi:predicted dehydrogenase
MAQAKKIADAVEAKKLVTCVGFQDRYLDIVDRVKEELKDMKVGMVYGFWLGGVPQVWWWMKKSTCGGQLVEQNIHLVDLLRYFFGEADSVYATCGRSIISPDEFPDTLPEYETDDYSSAMITFKNGVTANLMSGCFITDKGHSIRSGITVIGRDKSVEYLLRDSTTVYTADSQLKYKNVANQSIAHDRAFLDAVRAKDPSAVRSSYGDAYKSLILADAANRSMATGQVVKL